MMLPIIHPERDSLSRNHPEISVQSFFPISLIYINLLCAQSGYLAGEGSLLLFQGAIFDVGQ